MSNRSTIPTGLPCPESWLDPDIVPLVTLLNRLGFETIWSCAGMGISRSGVEQPISRLPVKWRRKVKYDGEAYYIEDNHHEERVPYVAFRSPFPPPEWFRGVMRHLEKATIGGNDLYTDRFVEYADSKLIEVTNACGNDEINISMSHESREIMLSLLKIPVCRMDIVTMKKMWLHEMIKAFSFM